jgi:type VI secretion system protein ImpJ
MSFKRPIFWQQGTFLEPQHFQLLEVQRREELSSRLAAMQPWPWGLTDLEVNPDALGNMTFEPLRLDLWLPDGRHLSLPGNLQLSPRSFNQAWTNTDEPLAVFLAAPLLSMTGGNVNHHEATGGPQTQFRRLAFNAQADPDMVPDLLGGGPDGRVETLFHNAFLLFGPEAEQMVEPASLTPLARLARDGDRIRLVEDYAPPALRLYDASPVTRLMTDILEILKAKGRQFEEYKISPSQSQQENSAGTALSLVTILGVVCRYVARLHYLLFTQCLHPFAAFAAIRELAAELTIFAPGLTALGESLSGQGGGLRPYDHLDPFPAFQDTKFFITRLLDSISLGPELTLVFRREGRNFTLDLPASLTSAFICWLSVRSDLPREQAAESLSSFGKLAAPGRAENLVSFNLPGIALSLMAQPPLGLPRNPDTAYFSFRQSDPMWEEALRARRLILFWDRAPDQTIVTLSGNRL